MLYALLSGRVRHDLNIVEVVTDIETLNRLAQHELLDVSAVSAHAYLKISDRYYLMRHGCSFGIGYGPLLVSWRRLNLSGSERIVVAVPGANTTAALLVMLALGRMAKFVEIPYDLIPEIVAKRIVDAGVLIHEEQLALSRCGLQVALDLGRWWFETTRLPLPLGVNVVRRALGGDLASRISYLYRESIEYALRNREEALRHAMRFSRVGDAELVSKFIRMYVNDYSVDLRDECVKAILRLHELARESKIVSSDLSLEIV